MDRGPPRCYPASDPDAFSEREPGPILLEDAMLT
jgi:hypothetical protein